MCVNCSSELNDKATSLSIVVDSASLKWAVQSKVTICIRVRRLACWNEWDWIISYIIKIKRQIQLNRLFGLTDSWNSLFNSSKCELIVGVTQKTKGTLFTITLSDVIKTRWSNGLTCLHYWISRQMWLKYLFNLKDFWMSLSCVCKCELRVTERDWISTIRVTVYIRVPQLTQTRESNDLRLYWINRQIYLECLFNIDAFWISDYLSINVTLNRRKRVIYSYGPLLAQTRRLNNPAHHQC